MDCRADLRMGDLHVNTQGLVTIDESYDVGLDISGTITALDLSALPLLGLNFLPGCLSGDFSLFWQKIGAADQSGNGCRLFQRRIIMCICVAHGHSQHRILVVSKFSGKPASPPMYSGEAGPIGSSGV